MVEQNVRTALKFSDRALALEMGRLAVDRPASELLNDPNLNRLFLGGHAKPSASGNSLSAHRNSLRYQSSSDTFNWRKT